MDPVNIQHHGGDNSNYRLHDEKLTLYCKTMYYKPDGDGYEQVMEQTEDHVRYAQVMRLRGSRKQRAARAVSPKVSIIDIRKVQKTLVAPEIGDAIIEANEMVAAAHVNAAIALANREVYIAQTEGFTQEGIKKVRKIADDRTERLRHGIGRLNKVDVAEARVEGDKKIKIAQLEAKIREIMGLMANRKEKK